MLIDHMAEGNAIESFAGKLRVSKVTIYAWCDKHKEFMNAKRIGESKCYEWWEKMGRDHMVTQGDLKFNTTLWIFNMKNRFGWRDKREIDVQGQIDVKPVRALTAKEIQQEDPFLNAIEVKDEEENTAEEVSKDKEE
jgi:hypothetical protein